MKKATLALFTFFTFSSLFSQTKVRTPDQVYGDLFKDVQMSRIFPDGKTFVDCVPKKGSKGDRKRLPASQK